jgi:tetratricopeptide (TPR) repeat protein
VTEQKRQPIDEGDRVEVRNSGEASADNGSVANTGVMGNVHIEHHHTPPAPVWPMLVGHPPPLASAFQPRRNVRDRVRAARQRGEDVILTQQNTTAPGGTGTRVLAGGGGVGKSQLAAWFAGQAIEGGTDLVVWVNASAPEQVTAAFATAAVQVDAPGAVGVDPVADAAALVQWLHTTDRTWLIVLDDVTDTAHLAGRWPPHRPGGWTLATTRLREATLTGSGRQRVDVAPFIPGESSQYLLDRLTDDGCAHLLDEHVPELAAALGHLPLALSHAAAYMLDQDEPCGAYLTRYTAGDDQLDDLMPVGIDPDAYGRPVAVALLLALDAADTRAPAGLARPALMLAAVCDTAGHPGALWATQAVTGYLTAHRTHHSDDPVTPEQARAALRTLHRYGLITHTTVDNHHTVRIHALTARAARETTASALATVAHVLADALLQLWPPNDHTTTDLLTTLLANTTTLIDVSNDLLWHPDGHPLLYEAGKSLLNCGLHAPAIAYWRGIAAQAKRILGEEHPDTLTARANLASSYWQAGRTNDAITIEEQVLADRARLLGQEHPDTLTTRANLASSYWQAGRTNDAITLLEQVLTESVRLLGQEHPNTLITRANLAGSYQQAGRTNDAITLLEQVLTESVRLLGQEHPDTLTARGSLAGSYQQAGRTNDAITLQEQVLADRARLMGEEHPDTLTTRANLAGSYRQAGRTNDAITLQEQVLADRERLLGQEHPNTLTTRANLAVSYWQAGRTNDAITLQEQVLADRERLLGQEHPNTLSGSEALEMWRRKI